MIRRLYKSLPKQISYMVEPLAIRVRRLRDRSLFKFKPAGIFPRIIQIETNSFCGNNCLFCPYPVVRRKTENALMKEDVFKKIMDECSFYPVEIIYLCLMNDPLSDTRIVDFIDYAKLKNPKAKVKIITNAQFLTEDVARSLIDSKLDEARFSVHGWTNATYKKITGNSFGNAFKNIANFLSLVDRKKMDIGMVCVKTRYFTKKDYYAAHDFCKKHNVDFGLSQMRNMAGNLAPESAVKLKPKEMRRVKLKGCIDNLPDVAMHISYDGKAVSCCMDWYREAVLGDAVSSTLYDIWNNELYQDFRDKLYKNKHSADNFICKRCSESV